LVRYNSDPSQITNSIELSARKEVITRMQVITPIVSARDTTSYRWFPFLAYQISRPNTDMTFRG